MINALINSTSFNLEDVVRLLNHADKSLIPHLITANQASSTVCEAMTNIALMYPFLHLANGFSQIRSFLWRVL
jgi:hypothetical protein